MRTFFIVWGGQLISILGTGLTRFGIAFWVYDQTGSVTSLSVVILAGSIPGVILGPFAGTVIDRVDRRIVMIVTDTAAGLSTIVLAILWTTGSLELWHIVTLSAIGAIGESFQQPAYLASIPLLVPKDQLNRANGMANANQALSMVASPILAGFLIATVGFGFILLVDIATFAVAVTTLSIVRFPATPHPTDDASAEPAFLRETLDGLRYLLERTGLFLFLLLASVLNFLLAFINVLLFPLILSFADETVLGAIMSSMGLAMLAGSVVASIWSGPERRMKFMLSLLTLLGLFVALSGLKASAVWIAAWSVGLVAVVPIINATSQALWQSKIAPGYQGRVFALRHMIATMASPIAFALAGPLADNVFEPLLAEDGALADSVGQIIGTGPGRGIGFMYILGGLGLTLASVTGFGIKRLRNVETDIPDAIP